MKKFLRVLLVVCLAVLCLAAISSCSFDDSDTTTPKVTTKKATTNTQVPKGLTFEAVGTRGYAVDHYTGSATELVIPSTYLGKPVVAISSYAFANSEWLESVTIPNSVTSIGDCAFQGCESLQSVTIGNGVEKIGEWAFYGCKELKSVYITSITKWCDISFEDRYANPLHRGADLYVNRSLLTDLVIPNGVKNIRDFAFFECTSLESITIPDGVTSIGKHAFEGCESLTTAIFENTAGWQTKPVLSSFSPIDIPSTGLADTSIAATYLTYEYSYFTWTRE